MKLKKFGNVIVRWPEADIKGKCDTCGVEANLNYRRSKLTGRYLYVCHECDKHFCY